MLRRALAVPVCLVVWLVASHARAANAGVPSRPPAEIALSAESEGIVYVSGERLYPPYRLTVASGRVAVNGFDADPTVGPDDSPGAPLDPETARALDAIRAATARADALIESLRTAGEEPASIDERVAHALRSESLAADVAVRSEGGVLVAWRGFPGYQLVAAASRRIADSAAVADPDASARAEMESLASSLSRGELYAAGVGYRISLAGAIVDSVESAIARFEVSQAETLRVGRRTYFAFGRDLRKAWSTKRRIGR